MSVVGRFEILSPIFSGALDTSTARDPRTGDTVLLHLLPTGHADSPRDLFQKIASDWPGQVLDAGIDPETQRSFVVTDYPKDRKAFRLLIHELGKLTLPPDLGAPAGAPVSKPVPEPAIAAPVASPPPPPPPSPQSDPAADLLAFFKAQTAPPAKPPEPAADPAASGGATRLFDPSAVFGPGAVAASAAKASPEPSKPAPPQDGATRMFDPSAVFGAAATPAPPPKPPAAANDGATRMFDPSAVFGMAAPAPPKPAAPPAPPAPAQDGATRMFDPSAVFGVAAPKPKESAPPSRELSDSAKRAAEAFISGKLPEEFRNAPRNVQRSLEELLGKKPAEPDVEPTPGRPGVITLMFDSYGKRIEQSEASQPPANKQPAPPPNPNDSSTKIISSADLSAMFAAQAGASHPSEPGDEDKVPPPPAPKDRR